MIQREDLRRLVLALRGALDSAVLERVGCRGGHLEATVRRALSSRIDQAAHTFRERVLIDALALASDRELALVEAFPPGVVVDVDLLRGRRVRQRAARVRAKRSTALESRRREPASALFLKLLLSRLCLGLLPGRSFASDLLLFPVPLFESRQPRVDVALVRLSVFAASVAPGLAGRDPTLRLGTKLHASFLGHATVRDPRAKAVVLDRWAASDEHGDEREETAGRQHGQA